MGRGTIPKKWALAAAFAVWVIAASASTSHISPPPDANTKTENLKLFGVAVPPGTRRTVRWQGVQGMDSTAVSTPVLVVNGKFPGPTLCLTAAIHGDEVNGIEIVRQIVHGLDPETMHGAVVGVPIVNLNGFKRGSRYLPDRRDLNRHFPGHPEGSAAARLAFAFFSEVVTSCSALVDLHTGSFQRSNLPQIRANLASPAVRHLAGAFGGLVVLHHPGTPGTLRRAALDAGIPSVTLEAGGPQRLEADAVTLASAGIRSLMSAIGLIEDENPPHEPPPVYLSAHWVRSDAGGLLMSHVTLGDEIETGALLGTVTDPVSNKRFEIRAPSAGRVLGMALDQFVQPGFASYRIGIAAPDTDHDGVYDEVLSSE